MKRDFDHALDECLALLAERGATLEECLARYPEHAEELRPLLEMALTLFDTPRPAARPAAFAAGKERMLQALAEKKRRQASSVSRPRSPGWIAALLGRGEGRPGYRPSALRWALTAATALVLLVASGFLFLSWLQTPVARAATLVQVSGTVEILPEGEQTWRLAAVGERVEPGDRIRTGPSSAALLRFFNGSTTDLGAETVLSIVQISSRRIGGHEVIVLHQWIGESYYRVRALPDPGSEFKVETPAAVTRVRGTVFAVFVEEDGTTDVVVVEGKVDVIAQEAMVQVPAGQGTTVRPQHPPVPAQPAFVATPTPWPTPTPSFTPTSTPTRTPTPHLEEEPEGHEEMEPTEEPTETVGGDEEDHETPEPTEMPGNGEDEHEMPEPTEMPGRDEGGHKNPEPTATPEDDEGDDGTPEPTATPEEDGGGMGGSDDDGDSGDMGGGDRSSLIKLPGWASLPAPSRVLEGLA